MNTYKKMLLSMLSIATLVASMPLLSEQEANHPVNTAQQPSRWSKLKTDWNNNGRSRVAGRSVLFLLTIYAVEWMVRHEGEGKAHVAQIREKLKDWFGRKS